MAEVKITLTNPNAVADLAQARDIARQAVEDDPRREDMRMIDILITRAARALEAKYGRS